MKELMEIKTASTCMHPSVIEIVSNYPNIKLPPGALNMHLLPVIDLHRLEPSIVSRVLKMREVAQKEQIEPSLPKSSIPRLAPELLSTRKRKSDEAASSIAAKLPSSYESADMVNPESQELLVISNIVQVVTCDYCSKPFTANRSLQRHVKRNHLKCQFCQRLFQTSAEKSHHLEICSAKPILTPVKVIKMPLPIKMEVTETLCKQYSDSSVYFVPVAQNVMAQIKPDASSKITLTELLNEFPSDAFESTQSKSPVTSHTIQLSISPIRTILPEVEPSGDVVPKAVQEVEEISVTKPAIEPTILTCRKETVLQSTPSSNGLLTMDSQKIQPFKDEEDVDNLILPAKLKSISEPKPRQAISIDTHTSNERKFSQEVMPIAKSSAKSKVKIYDLSSVSVVQAEIKIQDNNLLDHINTNLNDTDIIKELLLNNEKNFHVEKSMQTALPETVDIINDESTVYFHNLMPQLHSLIPVDIQIGSLEATYRKKSSKLDNQKKTKPFRTWTNLNKQTIAKTDCSLFKINNMPPSVQTNPSDSNPPSNRLGLVPNQGFQQNLPERGGFANIFNVTSVPQSRYNRARPYSHPNDQKK